MKVHNKKRLVTNTATLPPKNISLFSVTLTKPFIKQSLIFTLLARNHVCHLSIYVFIQVRIYSSLQKGDSHLQQQSFWRLLSPGWSHVDKQLIFLGSNHLPWNNLSYLMSFHSITREMSLSLPLNSKTNWVLIVWSHHHICISVDGFLKDRFQHFVVAFACGFIVWMDWVFITQSCCT